MNRTTTILTILFFLVSFHSYSQYFQSTNYREGTGLPSSETYSVFQDSQGFIWIATDNGVVKYDGREFVVYNTADGLTDNTVFGFHEDFKNRLWFRTYNGNLSYYEKDTIKKYEYNARLKSYINSSLLSDIWYDSLSTLYFTTTYGTQAAKIDSIGNASPLYGNILDEHSVAMNMDSEGKSWYFIGFILKKIIIAAAGAPREINALMIDGKKFPVDLDDKESQRNWFVGSVKWKGKYYFSIHKNIFTYDGQHIEKVFTSSEPMITLYVDHEDRLWAGSYNYGVDVFTDASMKAPFNLKTLSGLSVSSILQDYEGGLWVSTLDQGVFYFPNLTILNYASPNNARVNTMAYRENEVFIGNYRGEVFSMSDNGAVKLLSKAVAPIGNLFLDKEKKLWITDGEGTHIHQTGMYIGAHGGNDSKTFKALAQVDDYILGCGSMGIYKISLQGTILERVGSRARPISMTISGNQIYVGGLNGLEKRSLDFGGSISKIGDARTSSLHTIDDRFVMVGTAGRGLYYYDDRKEQLVQVPVPDIVNVYSIISDWPERRMWIGTDKGLYQLDFVKDTSELVLNGFSKADGLIATKINSVCRIGDNIWAISDLGISLVPLSHFDSYHTVPKFYINRILFKDHTIPANPSVVQTEQEDMVIDVRPITFKDHATFFRYRLDERQSWKMISGGSIFVTDLRPRTYMLEIQASTGNVDWTKSSSLVINVHAKWWNTLSFKIGAIVAIIGLGYFAYWLRIKAIRRRQKYLELINLHQQKLIDSEIRTQERERKRIATDLHDGIGASLSSIKLQVSDVLSDDAVEIEARGKEINDHLTDVIADIKRIVYDLHPPSLERYGLQAALKSMVDRINKTSDLNVIFDYYGQREIVQPISITIFRILQELINNTMKHARASEVRIHINEFEDEINIMYEDNGIGMIGSRFTGLGLHSIESRVRSLNGRMTWESNHKGTFYNFDIPF